jgi:hypothetical protein
VNLLNLQLSQLLCLGAASTAALFLLRLGFVGSPLLALPEPLLDAIVGIKRRSADHRSRGTDAESVPAIESAPGFLESGCRFIGWPPFAEYEGFLRHSSLVGVEAKTIST